MSDCAVAFVGAGGMSREHMRAFRDVPGVRLAGSVITVEDAPAFSRTLRMLADPQAREALAARQRAFAATSNLLDGRAGERLLGLIDSLARR